MKLIAERLLSTRDLNDETIHLQSRKKEESSKDMNERVIKVLIIDTWR